jgi:hypothetical protein
MGAAMTTVDDVQSDIKASATESDYAAVNTLWLALLKLANTQPGSNEKARMVALFQQMPIDEVKAIINMPAVDTLLDLDPPLETLLASPYEQKDPEGAQRAINQVRENRANNPTAALLGIGWLLKRIRNKREHAFKTRDGPRDSIILGAGRSILDALCHSALTHTGAP